MFFFVIFIHQGLRSLNELEPDYQLANQRWLIILKVAMSTVNCVIFNCRVCLQERLLQNYHPEDSIICPRSEFIPLIKMHAGPSPSRFIPRQNSQRLTISLATCLRLHLGQIFSVITMGLSREQNWMRKICRRGRGGGESCTDVR